MRLLFLILLLAVAAVAQSPNPPNQPPAPAQPSAIIAQLKGQALGKSPQGKFTPASLSPLVPGTLLKLAPGATVEIRFLGDGHHETYTGPCIVGIGAKKGTNVQGPAPATSTPLPTLGLRPEGLLPPPSPQPSGTELSLQLAADGNPQFSWTTDVAGPYSINVSDPPKAAAVWGAEVAGTSAEYGGPPLNKDDTYVWSLSANGKQLGAMKFALPTPKTLENLGAAQAQVDTSNQASHNALLAAAYEQNGLIQPAIICSRKALEQAPDDPSYMRRLGTMLGQAKQYADAHYYEEQARFAEDNLAPLVPDEGFYDMYWDYYGY